MEQTPKHSITVFKDLEYGKCYESLFSIIAALIVKKHYHARSQSIMH